MQEVNKLKRENRDLRMGGGGDGGGGGDDSALRDEIRQLQNQLEASRRNTGGGGSGGGTAVVAKVRDVYESINDVVSQWRDDMRTLEDLIDEIKRVMDAVNGVNLSALPSSERMRLEGLLSEVDPGVTLEDISNLVSTNREAAGSIKGQLRELREVIQ